MFFYFLIEPNLRSDLRFSDADMDRLPAVVERQRVRRHRDAAPAAQHGVAARDRPGKQVKLYFIQIRSNKPIKQSFVV